MKPWPNQTDQGVYQLTKEGMDKMVFKVPSLRNIKKTGPYFHDGSVPTLDQAIRNMAVHQRGVTLTDAQVKSIEIWMDSLTGQVPINYIKPRNCRRALRKLHTPAASNKVFTHMRKSISKTGGRRIEGSLLGRDVLRFTVHYIACSRRAPCLFGSSDLFSPWSFFS